MPSSPNDWPTLNWRALDAENRLRETIRHSLADWAEFVLAPLHQRPAAHHLALIAALEDVADGCCDRLMVLMPPGSAKSTYASVVFPAWWFARHPASAVIAASHTLSLARHFGRRLRNLIDEHASRLGVRLARDSRAAASFATLAGGAFHAAGVRGPITGHRADLVLIDDPVKSHQEADSRARRQQLWDWYRTELATRLKPGGRIVLIMTRWHEDDLGGRLLASGDPWRVLRLPALAEEADPLGREPGAALWPEWEDAAALSRKRAIIGERAWAALYQQTPRKPEGLLFRIEAIETTDAVAAGAEQVRAWDLAATAPGPGRDPDWTAGVRLAREPSGRFVVEDVVRLRGGPAAVEQAILDAAERDGRQTTILLPQDPGQAGRAQVLYLTRRLAGFHIAAGLESGSKTLRALPAASQAEAGNLAVLRAGWNGALLDELREFPHGAKDDQVDALSRAFAHLATRAAPTRQINLPLLNR